MEDRTKLMRWLEWQNGLRLSSNSVENSRDPNFDEHGDKANVWYELGKRSISNDQCEIAIGYLNNAIALNGSNTLFRLNLVACYMRMRNWAKMAIEAEQVLIRDAHSPRGNLYKGMADFYLGKIEKSIPFFQICYDIAKQRNLRTLIIEAEQFLDLAKSKI